jgi:Virulence factor BrkB
VNIARWPILFVVARLMIAVVYHFGPSRDRSQWRWISPGSLFAALVWIAASLLFSWYTSHFGSYNKHTARWDLDVDLHDRHPRGRQDQRRIGASDRG